MDPAIGLHMARDACERVIEGAERFHAHSIVGRVATSPRTGGFVHAYDTLELQVSPSRSASDDRKSTVLREVLATWHDISLRPNHSFQKNLLFWMVVLKQKPPESMFVEATAVFDFPRLVLYYERYRFSDVSNDMEDVLVDLQRNVLDLFFLSPDAVNSQTIDCTLRIRLRKSAKTTKTLLDNLATQAQAYETQRHRAHKRFVWSTVEIIARHFHEGRSGQGLDASHVTLVEKFCQALPPAFHVSLQFPSTFIGSIESKGIISRRTFAPFVQHACGFAPTNDVDHLQVLDLTSLFRSSANRRDLQPELTSLCTLLPFTTSLCELRLEVTSRHEFLWLGYALFHPRLSQTKLRRLALNFDKPFQHEMDFQDWKKLLMSQWRLETLKNLLTQTNRQQEIKVQTALLWSSGSISKRASLHESADASTPTLSLKVGTNVELCCTEQSQATMVPVIVPGHGLGWVLRSHISPAVITVRYEEPPRPLLTDVVMDDTVVSPSNQVVLLQLFGASLVHFRTRQPRWLQSIPHNVTFRDLLSRLETVDCVSFSPALAASDFGQLPRLQTLGLRCTGLDMKECVSWLSRRERFVTLRRLRLHVLLDVRTQTTEVGKLATALVFHRRSLRHYTISLVHVGQDRRMNPYGQSILAAEPDVARRKCALLSVVRHLQSTSSTHALVSFDAFLFRHLFEYWGSSVESVRIYVVSPSQFGAILPQNEQEIEASAAWYDEHS